MKSGKITKFKFFFSWQECELNTWLEDMSQQGWQLENVTFLCIFTFKLCENNSCIYQVDYNPIKQNNYSDYFDTFRDKGWKHVSSDLNWHYFSSSKGSSLNKVKADNDFIAEKFKRINENLKITLIPVLIPMIILSQFVTLNNESSSALLILILLTFMNCSIIYSLFRTKRIINENTRR